jgi:hypothetical protein
LDREKLLYYGPTPDFDGKEDKMASEVRAVSAHIFVSVDDEADTADSLGKSDVVMNHRVTSVVALLSLTTPVEHAGPLIIIIIYKAARRSLRRSAKIVLGQSQPPA